MQQLNELKDKSQQGLTQVVDASKQQAGKAKTFAVTAGSAIVGSIALAAAAQPIIALTSTLAAPPVALAVGAVAGGALGWRFVRRKANGKESSAAAAELQAAAPADAPADAPIPAAA